MANFKERTMNIQWVLADNLILDPTADLARMRESGAFWGSWKTWRAYGTDNVICHDFAKSQELVKRSFQTKCNLYIPNSSYEKLSRPQGVKLYEGSFMGHDVDGQDEIIAMNLAASVSEVVLLIGFDWSQKLQPLDKFAEIKTRNYQGMISNAVRSMPNTQWILVDHPGDITPELAVLPNLGQDSLANVFAILNA